MLKLNELKVKRRSAVLLSCDQITMKAGEIVGILGLNGAGKTTLIKAILNLIQHEGSADLDEWEVAKHYDKVAYISEEYSFIPYFTPYQYGCYLLDYYPRFDFDTYQQRCSLFDLEMDKKIERMSRGQQLKVEIAAGLSQRAQLIIMDEPFTNLDVVSKGIAVQMLINSLQENEIVLVATHDLDEIENVLDRCLILDKGVIKDDFYVEELHAKSASLRDYFYDFTKQKSNL